MKIIHITGVLIFCASLSAQEPIRYTTKQGLPTNHVYDIAEDADGFMWFATKQGVVKFDGETFRTFTIKDGLPNNDTWKLETDFQGRIWYFSKSAYQGYIQNDSVYKFLIEDDKVFSPRIIHKSNGALWLQKNLGLHRLIDTVFALEYNQEYYIKTQKALAGKKGDEKITSLLIPVKEKYLGWYKKGIFILDQKKNKEIVIPTPFEEVIAFGYKLMPNNTFFISFKKGIVFINLDTYESKIFLFKDIINQNEIEEIRCSPLKNQIQISGSGFLLTFDYDFNLQQHYTFQTTERPVFSYQDAQGNIWQNSLSRGITLIPNTQIQTYYYLKNQKVQRIGLYNNSLFAGIQNKGFYQFNKEQNDFQKRNDIPGGDNIYNIKKNSQSQTEYLISHYNSYILENSSISPLTKQSDLKANEGMGYFKDALKYNETYYFIGSGYFSFYNTSPNSSHTIQKEGLLFLEVFNDSIYAGGSDGLYQLADDKLIKPKSQKELLNTPITSLLASINNLLVGTDGRGAYLYNGKEIFHLKETDGLSIKRILKEADTLWLATQIGVKKVLLNHENLTQSKIVDAFYETDGILQNNTNDIYKKDNLFYVASDIGLAKINLNNPVYKKQPKLYFKTKSDTLNYKNSERDNIAITFALQDYVNQEYVTYQYKLLPTQKDWTTTETKTLNFTNLSPKLYQLEIKATDQHGNENISRQYLNIIPAWYQTLAVRIGFGILVLASIYLLFRILKQRVQKREHSKAQQEKREAGLELQALRSQMNPHFVHNSLNAIQYFIQRNEVELSENYLSKFSQLIRLFFEYSRRQTITIKEELELLTNYLEIEKLRFEEKLQFHITVCKNIDPEEQLIPSMLLQPIVENAVNHGLFHKKESGTVEVLFKQLNENTYEVTVKDDGIGINKAKSIYNVSSKNYQSNSSKVLYERLELLNKSKEWTIEYKIEDISDIDVTKTGTIVTLIFKQNMMGQ